MSTRNLAAINARIEEIGNLLAWRTMEDTRANFAHLLTEQEQLRAEYMAALEGGSRERHEELQRRTRAGQ